MRKEIQLEIDLRKRLTEGFDLIQVILGPRQVGKTTTILKIMENQKDPYLYFAAEEKVSTTADWLDELWQKAIEKSPDCFLIIDEVQKISDWSERIKTLWDAQKRKKKTAIKLILLGSISVKIHQGLTESLTGRFELIRAYHWSLKESTILVPEMNLDDYLLYGGYPGSYKFVQNKKRFENYLNNSIINTVIEKDLLTTGKVRNPALFKQTFQLLQTLPSTEISYTKMLGQLHEKGNTDLIKNYLNLFEGAYLVTQIHKYNPKTFKSRLSTPKIISMAPALSELSAKSSSDFLGLCFESLVGADLIKAGLNVQYWRNADYEVDFVFQFEKKLIAVEVKSGKRKSSKSIPVFKKEYSQVQIIYINEDNYLRFAESPADFIKKLI